jgi:carbonic anhydrase/acetyltransferase-like protein (isoleucine patch superfamily)
VPDNTRFRPELIHPTAFVAETARIVGDTSIGLESSIWFQVVLRGDAERIVIGAQTNVQDACVLHADPGFPCVLGDRVTIGHAAVVHGARVAEDVLIGIRAVVLNGAQVGAGSLVAAGSLVTEGTIIPPGSLVMGMPAKVIGPLPARLQTRITHAAQHYVELARQYRDRW